jgi:hypothetical protein
MTLESEVLMGRDSLHSPQRACSDNPVIWTRRGIGFDGYLREFLLPNGHFSGERLVPLP